MARRTRTNQLVAITSWGISPNCTGVDYQARLDVAEVLNWLSLYL